MSAIRDLDRLLAELRPELRPGRWVFVSVPGDGPGDVPAGVRPVMTFAEDEGLTLIVAREQADAAGLAYELETAWITLRVHSALAAVGLTAAVSAALTSEGISGNVVAAAFHDHLFVPSADAGRAVAALERLSARAG